MALRIHLGMISRENWNKLVNVYYNESTRDYSFNQWMKTTYDAVEITDNEYVLGSGGFQVFEFSTKEKYTEFCLTWL